MGLFLHPKQDLGRQEEVSKPDDEAGKSTMSKKQMAAQVAREAKWRKREAELAAKEESSCKEDLIALTREQIARANRIAGVKRASEAKAATRKSRKIKSCGAAEEDTETNCNCT